MGRYVKAMELSRLSPGTMAGVQVDGICTHEDSLLSEGFMVEDRVVCKLHLSQFNLRTGEVANPPAFEPLKLYNVKIEEGNIFVEI